jgi:Flp pilus assembly protein TadB
VAIEQPPAEESAHVVHRHERPEDWGWHAEMGRTARVAAVITILFLCVLTLATHISQWEIVWVLGIVGCLVVSLLWDRNRRRNSWRS